MRLSILCIGKMKAGPERDLLARYADRAGKAGRQLGIHGIDIREWAESRAANAAQRKQEEAEIMLAGCPSGALLVALDEHGDDLTSQQFAGFVEKALASGTQELCLAIGGPDGHGGALLARADKTLRLGRMTWPHQMVRVLAAEQLYRAISILSNHPYHRQ